MKTLTKSIFVILISLTLMGNSIESFDRIQELEDFQIILIEPPVRDTSDYDRIEILANELNINPDDLWNLIFFETAQSFNPKSANPNSSAKGLIQFTNATANTIRKPDGSYYKSSNELITICSTSRCQLLPPGKENRYGGPIYQYLKRFGKIKDKKHLFMAVFHPASIGKCSSHTFSKNIQNVNPGISTIDDYVKNAEKIMPKKEPYFD